MIKKFSAFLLALVVLASISASGCASEGPVSQGSPQDLDPETYTAIREAELVEWRLHASEETLRENGFSESSIQKIRSGEYEQSLRDEVMYRASLDEETLASSPYHYTPEQIEALKSFSGDEPIVQMLAVTGAKVLIDKNLILYYYYTSLDMTHFVVEFDWEWTSAPVDFGAEELIGISWNNDYMLGYPIRRSWNYHYVTYQSVNNPKDNYNVSVPLEETQMCLSEYPFKFQEDVYQAMSGTVTVSLCAAGRLTNSKILLKYGHTSIGFEYPAIVPGLKPDISFSFENVTDEYASNVYTARTPTTKDGPVQMSIDDLES